MRRADLPALRPTCFHGGVQNPACVPFSVAPSVVAVPRRYRNVRLLRIGYAFRPRNPTRLRTILDKTGDDYSLFTVENGGIVR